MGDNGDDDLNVHLVIKNPSSTLSDFHLDVPIVYSVEQVKQEIAKRYPEKPPVADQKLIFAGKILSNDLLLLDVFKQHELTQPQTWHIVIAPPSQPASTPSSSGTQQPQPAPQQPPAGPNVAQGFPPGAMPGAAAGFGFPGMQGMGAFPADMNAFGGPAAMAANPMMMNAMYLQAMQYMMMTGQWPPGMPPPPGMGGMPTSPPGAAPNIHGLPYPYGPQMGAPAPYGMPVYMPPMPPGGAVPGGIPVPPPAAPARPPGQGLGARLQRQNFKLLAKLALLVFIVCQDAGSERMLLGATVAFLVYLHETGRLAFLRRFAPRVQQRVPQSAQPGAPPPAPRTPGQRVGGFFMEIRDLLVAFFSSLIPSWQPLPPHGAAG